MEHEELADLDFLEFFRLLDYDQYQNQSSLFPQEFHASKSSIDPNLHSFHDQSPVSPADLHRHPQQSNHPMPHHSPHQFPSLDGLVNTSDGFVSTSNSVISSDGGEDDCSSAQEKEHVPAQSRQSSVSRPVDLAEARASGTAEDQEQKEQPRFQADDKTRGKLAGRVKKPRKEHGPKFAIRIQNDVEIIDDGYKWRKYGQKAVKNSPYARSYYKCTDKQCGVKKHVERQAHEPLYVVTTYEGTHNHARAAPIPVVHQPIFNLPQAYPYSLPLIQMGLLGALSQASSYPMPQNIQLQNTRPDQGLLEDMIFAELRRNSI